MALEAKKAQVDQIKNYVGGCQGFFELIISKLILQQPSDPHSFLLDFLRGMSADEKAKWAYKMGGLANPNAESMSRVAASKKAPPVPGEGAVQVILRLPTMEKGDKYHRTMSLLEDLRNNALPMSGCLHFEIYEGDESDILVLQTWTGQEALDLYHASAFFATATRQFANLLTSAPEFDAYVHHKSTEA